MQQTLKKEGQVRMLNPKRLLGTLGKGARDTKSTTANNLNEEKRWRLVEEAHAAAHVNENMRTFRNTSRTKDGRVTKEDFF